MAYLLNRCRFVAGSAGTSDFTDGTAEQGFVNLAGASAVNGRIYPYAAENATRTEWEIGYGTFNSGTGVLARTTVVASSTGSKVSFATNPLVLISPLVNDIKSVVSATSRVLGRKAAGAGDPEECSLSEVLDFIGSAAQGDLLYRGASTWARLGAGTAGYALKTGGASANPAWAPSREVLTGNRTYYVRSDGNDANTGLSNTSGGAFLTIQKAIDVATSLDLGIYNVTIQVADGTYAVGNTLKSYVGAGPITIQGNTTTPANVLISTGSVDSFFASGVLGKWVLKGMKTVTSAAYHFQIKGGTIVDFDRWDFGACPSYYHIQCDTKSTVSCVSGSYSITGSAAIHWRAAEHAAIRVFSSTITLSGTPAFGIAFGDVSYGSEIISNATFSGSATGKRYQSATNSWIETFGGGANYFPGNSAGSTATGGLYIA